SRYCRQRAVRLSRWYRALRNDLLPGRDDLRQRAVLPHRGGLRSGERTVLLPRRYAVRARCRRRWAVRLPRRTTRVRRRLLSGWNGVRRAEVLSPGGCLRYGVRHRADLLPRRYGLSQRELLPHRLDLRISQRHDLLPRRL